MEGVKTFEGRWCMDPTGHTHSNTVPLAAAEDDLTISLIHFWLVVCIHGQQEPLL